jgi:hypothetical protein
MLPLMTKTREGIKLGQMLPQLRAGDTQVGTASRQAILTKRNCRRSFSPAVSA